MSHEALLMDKILEDVLSRCWELSFSVVRNADSDNFTYVVGPIDKKHGRGIKLSAPASTDALLGTMQIVFDSIQKTIKHIETEEAGIPLCPSK